MHDLSHAYHCLSDIMCDFNTQPQRALRCRPVLIQHSAVLHTGMLPANRLTGVNFRNPVRSGRTAPQNPGNAQLTTNASDTSTPNASDAARREQQLIAAIPVGENEIPAIVIEGKKNVGFNVYTIQLLFCNSFISNHFFFFLLCCDLPIKLPYSLKVIKDGKYRRPLFEDDASILWKL